MRTKVGKTALIWLLVLALTAPAGAIAQDTGQPEETPLSYTYTQEDLDQMLAPIALYPDELLSQILMASTYPLEVVEADRWLKKNPSLTGDQLDEALKDQPWDVSVKSLCYYPSVLSTMSENLTQTSNLGEAFLSQEDQVMDTVQRLRDKAQAQGNLKSTEQQTVVVEGPDIIIQPANPQVVYIPAYDPCWVYGPWWYPRCSPLWFWYPGLWVTGAFYFGPPIFIGYRGSWCGFQWRRHRVFVDVNRTLSFHRAKPTRMHGGREIWRHDPGHRRGVAYRNEATRQQYGQGGRPGVDARRNFRGFGQDGRPPGGVGVERQGTQPRGQETQRFQPRGPETGRSQSRDIEVERLQPRVPEGQRPQPRGQEIERQPSRTPEGQRLQPKGPEVQRPAPRAPEAQRIQPRADTGSLGARGVGSPRSSESNFQGLGSGPEVRQQSERGWSSMGTGMRSTMPQGGQPSSGGLGSSGGIPGGGGSRGGGVSRGGSPGGGGSQGSGGGRGR